MSTQLQLVQVPGAVERTKARVDATAHDPADPAPVRPAVVTRLSPTTREIGRRGLAEARAALAAAARRTGTSDHHDRSAA